jgi:hypothetical protein
MADVSHDNDAQALWQSQPRGEPVISLEEIRARARRMERRVARRNVREYVALPIVVAAFGSVIWVGPTSSMRVGAGLIIAAAVFVVYRIHRRGTATSLPADLASNSALHFHRAQLEGQRDLLRSVWSWALLPFVPGILLMLIGASIARPEWMRLIVAYGISFAGLMIGLHVLNRGAAARIQHLLDRLPERL